MKLLCKATARWLIALVHNCMSFVEKAHSFSEHTMARKSHAKIVITFAHTPHLELMDRTDQDRLQVQNQRV